MKEFQHKRAKRHSQHRQNKKDWFKLRTNALQIVLTRKSGKVTQPTFIMRSLPLHFPVGDNLCTDPTRKHTSKQTNKQTYVRTCFQEFAVNHGNGSDGEERFIVCYVKQLCGSRVSLSPWSERPGALNVVRGARGDHEIHRRCGWDERRAGYRVAKSAAVQPAEHTQNLLNSPFHSSTSRSPPLTDKAVST